MDLVKQFQMLLDPGTTLGAFLISVAASIVVGFFSGKSYQKKVISRNSMIVGNNSGTINQNVKMGEKREEESR